jgi:hypothetical protein
MKLILLTQNKFVKVSDEDYEYLSKWGWYYNEGYAVRKENGRHLQMHRVIMGAIKGQLVDHKNSDTLDNQRENLRLCNHSTNAMNMRKHKGSSIYKGVIKTEWGYRTQIWKDNEKVFDASCKEERWAAYMYDLNASALFGEFFRPNFPNAILVAQE